MSNKRTDTILIDSDKLIGLLAAKGISAGAFSERIGYQRGWLSKERKRSKRPPYIKISRETASCIEEVLSCTIQDITSPEEPMYSVLQPVERKVFNEILDDLPADKYEVLRAFMTYIRDSDSADCANLLGFFNHSKALKQRYAEELERITSDSGPEYTVGIMGSICEPMRVYETDDWLYAYIMRVGMWTYFETFYKELGERLTVANEENWKQKVFRTKKECDGKGGWLEFRQKVLDSLRRELQRSNNDGESALEAAFDMASQRLLEDCRNFLIDYFIKETTESRYTVGSLKAGSLKAASKDSAKK